MRFILIILLYTVAFGLNASSRHSQNNFLVITDIHLDKTFKHSMDFKPSKNSVFNDMDETSLRDLLKTTEKNITEGVIPAPKFILFLGDAAGHLRFLSRSTISNETTVFQFLQHYFPQTPILSVFGNNDSIKANYGPFYSHGMSPFVLATKHAHWQNGFLSTGIQCNLTTEKYPCLIEENKIGGYYSAYLEPQLRLIAINSVMFSPSRKNTDKEAPSRQLQWLNQELQKAQIKQESVILAMHLPPGMDNYPHDLFWNKKDHINFLNLIKTYKKNIAGILASHTHFDELKIIQNSNHQNLVGVYINPALSTSHSNFPAIKSYQYTKDNDQWILNNSTTFSFYKNNKRKTIGLKKLYDFTDYYCDGKTQNLLFCLRNLTLNKLNKYYTAGNDRASNKITNLDDVYIFTK